MEKTCNNMRFKKGQIPWNKGKHIQTNTGRTHFKKGYAPWHKGTKGLACQSLEEAPLIADGHGYLTRYSNGRRFLEHQLVWCKANNINHIPKGFIVHHLNDIKIDNRPENLLLLDRSTHCKLHYEMRRTD